MKKTVTLAVLGAILSIATAARAAETNCEKTGVSKVFSNEYAQASAAWCQANSKATYMLSSLLNAIATNKAQFVGGSADLIGTTGFTAIALGGYKLDSGMIHRRDGKKYISVHFTGTDAKNNDVKSYEATYQVDESVFGDTVQKN